MLSVTSADPSGNLKVLRLWINGIITCHILAPVQQLCVVFGEPVNCRISFVNYQASELMIIHLRRFIVSCKIIRIRSRLRMFWRCWIWHNKVLYLDGYLRQNKWYGCKNNQYNSSPLNHYMFFSKVQYKRLKWCTELAKSNWRFIW